MSKAKFTFCVPNLNKIRYLPTCIESILAQDCDHWTCVFVDGYSNDGCWEYMRQFANHPQFKILRGARQGMYPDWNICLEHVETEYFYFLTSDDTCAANLVSVTTAALDQFPTLDACHFKFDFINEAGAILPQKKYWLESSIYSHANTYPHIRPGLFEFLMHYTYRAIYTTITSLVFRKPLIQQLQGFKSIYSSSGDYDWTMRMALCTDVLYLPETLATWRVYQEQATRQVQRFDYHQRSLAIAKDNLKSPQLSALEAKLGITIAKHILLRNFLDNHAAFLRKKMMHPSSWQEFIQFFQFILQENPSYIPRTLIKKLTLNTVFPGFDPLKLSQELVKTCHIHWPPEPTSINRL